MDRSAAQAWLDRYVDAWKSYDENDIGDLFAEDAVYRYHPFDTGDDVLTGRDAIVASWSDGDGQASSRDPEGTYDGRYEVWAVDGDRVVATGQSRYWSDASRSTLERMYHNVFLVRFDEDGRCREFTELYMKEPDAPPVS